MTNNLNTITLNHSAHGTYRVLADHLDTVVTQHHFNTHYDLIREINNLVGVKGDYDDLSPMECYILISYLTGGIAD